VLAAVALFGCQTVPTEIPDDLTQAELIQRAQESADQDNWDAALAYYEAIVDRYPEDRSATATARYEMAFIEYKRGDLDAAESGFEELIGMYDFESDAIPAWPRVLAVRLLEIIEDERRAESAPATAAE
jgi:outer membrane protein assembly factor BamD (BamD/ComL family)